MYLLEGLRLLLIICILDLSLVYASEAITEPSNEATTTDEIPKKESLEFEKVSEPTLIEQSLDIPEKEERNKISDENITKKEANKTLRQKKLSFTGGGQFTHFFSNLVDPSFSFNLNLGYAKNKKVQMGLSQSISKLLVKNKDQDEVVLQDTILNYTYKPAPTFFNGGHASIGGSLKLPLSQYSRMNGIWTSVSLGTSLTWFYLDREISNSLGASGSFYLNQYKTKHTEFGGSALPYMIGSLSWSISYSGQKDFVYGLSASYGEIRYHNINNENFLADSSFDHPYSVGLSMSYLVMEGMRAGASYGQSNIFEQYGKLDYYVFDQEASNMSLFMSYTKSL
ncbi:MAG: hypothetical protein AB8G05_26435 [Oligoflexales bacterium]